jgi:predicted outer membrane repeat protein
VTALAVYDDGTGAALYAAGSFTHAGQLEATGIAKWNGSTWSALQAGINGPATALAPASPGLTPRIYTGGEFTLASGVPALRVAGWNGSAWTPLGMGLEGGAVRALVTWDSGVRLYAAGEFMTAGGVPANRIARWDGVAWAPLGAGLNGAARALTVFAPELQTAKLYVGGEFTGAGASMAQYVAAWNGTSWSAVGSGPPAPARTLAGYDNRTQLVRDCVFYGNHAGTKGGGVWGGRTIANCVFSGNSAENGGAVFCGDTQVINSTFAGNTASQLCGGVMVSATTQSMARISNCVVYFNTDGQGSGQGAQVTQFTGSVLVNSSCIQGLNGSLGGSGNTGANPLFVDRDGPDNTVGTADDNLRVLAGSPLIDHGDMSLLTLTLLRDAAGTARFTDGDRNGTVVLDMGAYEYEPPPCYPNCDGSTILPILNVNDFLCFLNRFAAGDTWANCDGSSLIPVLNVNDYFCFLNAYAQGCP